MHATSHLISRSGRYAAHASLAAIALASLTPAAAQTIEPQTETAASEEARGQDIIVTGTRVARDGFQAPTPLTVLTTEDIQNSSPTNNIADFVNQLPSLAGSTRPSNSRLNLSSGQAGINALNLRNLGDIRTLVLIDGRRSVGSAITGQVDVNTIPQLLVERVEVVTGGASAAYGSDAVAGVVNFVLDKDYEGLKITADSGVTTHGDGFNYSVGIAGGLSFADGRGHLLVSGEVAHRDGIFQVDRDWNQIGFRTITDPPGYAPGNGRPRNIRVLGAGTNNALPGGIINSVNGSNSHPLRGLYFGQGGSVNQFDYGSLFTSSLSVGGDWRLADNSRNIGLDPEDDRYGLFGRVSYQVTPGIEIFAEAAYNQQESLFNAGPQLAGSVAYRSDNAFLINTLGAARLVGVDTVAIGTTGADLPFRKSNNSRDVQRYAIGVEGAFDLFGKPAPWSIYGQYGQTNMHEQLRDIMHVTRMANATDAVFAAAGNSGGYAPGTIVCRINVDPDAANNDPNCVPLNRLGTGVANTAAFPYVLGDPFRDEKLEQTVAGANLSVTPFATWAGDVSVAVGAEYRKEQVEGFVPVEFQPIASVNSDGEPTTTNVWSVGNYLPTNGSYDVKEAYLETVVPLGFGLEFNGAVRATDYSTAGYVTTWKVGATWQPIDDIRLRASRSRDIRAPNLNELFQAGSSNSDSVSNPFFNTSLPISRENPRSYSYSAIVTGNTNLRPEKADSLSLGAVVTPRFLPGFSASVDYFRIEIEDGIGNLGAQEIINRCFDGRQEFCDAYTVDPTRSTNEADYLTFRTSPFNFSSQLVRGIDFEASYRLPLDRLFDDAAGDFTLRGLATRYLDNIIDNGVPTTIPVNTVGANGGQFSTPKWLYRFSAAYDTPNFSITGIGRGISSGKYIASAIECQTDCPPSTTQNPTYDDNSLPGVFYADLNLTAKFDIAGDADGQFFINVTNLFDADPLLLPEGGLSANSTFSDLLGRSYRFGFRIQLR